MSSNVAKWLERKREMQQSREEANMGSNGSCSLAASEGDGT